MQNWQTSDFLFSVHVRLNSIVGPAEAIGLHCRGSRCVEVKHTLFSFGLFNFGAPKIVGPGSWRLPSVSCLKTALHSCANVEVRPSHLMTKQSIKNVAEVFPPIVWSENMKFNKNSGKNTVTATIIAPGQLKSTMSQSEASLLRLGLTTRFWLSTKTVICTSCGQLYGLDFAYFLINL